MSRPIDSNMYVIVALDHCAKPGVSTCRKRGFFVAKLPVTKHSKGRGAKRKDAAFVCHQDRLPTMSASQLSRGAKFSVVFFRKCAKEHGQINQTMASNAMSRIENQDGTCLVQILLSHTFLP